MTDKETFTLLYNDADRQIHWLSQIIAKANRALVPPEEDDSHTNFWFDPIGKKLTSRWIESPKGEIILSLNLSKKSFEWLNKNMQTESSIDILNKEMIKLEEEVSLYPESIGLHTGKLADPLHFKIPDYNIRAIGKDDFTKESIESWSRVRELANYVCLDMLAYLQADNEIRIWPHHFDTGIYTFSVTRPAIGFGLAMQDSMAGGAYFYIAAYGEEGIYQGELPGLATGRWEISDQWKGAILLLTEISGRDLNTQLAIVRTFINETISCFLKT